MKAVHLKSFSMKLITLLSTKGNEESLEPKMELSERRFLNDHRFRRRPDSSTERACCTLSVCLFFNADAEQGEHVHLVQTGGPMLTLSLKQGDVHNAEVTAAQTNRKKT